MRVIDRLRQQYPDSAFSWRWSPQDNSWYNEEFDAVAYKTATLKRCCMDPCDHYRTVLMIQFPKYGPRPSDFSASGPRYYFEEVCPFLGL